MNWQVAFVNLFGPGLFTGTNLADFRRLLRENRFRIPPRRWHRLSAALQNSVFTSLVQRRAEQRYAAQWEATEVQPPLFILGHWRSGTTHLHNLLACDDRFAFPNLYQVMYPHVFLSTEHINTKWMNLFLPKSRFGLDNVRLDWSVPYEEEFALAAVGRSVFLGWAWPQNVDTYDRYLTLQDVPTADVEHWKQSLIVFLQKVSFKYQKPLILKSPTHTARIKLLMELFPDAKFVHLHRNPYDVFLSRQRLDAICLRSWAMQSTRSVDWNERILRLYRQMHEALFEELPLIPSGRFHEIRYADLERDPMGTVRRTYEALDLPSFRHVEPQLARYLKTISGYRKNSHDDIPPDIRRRIAQQWGAMFERLAYST